MKTEIKEKMRKFKAFLSQTYKKVRTNYIWIGSVLGGVIVSLAVTATAYAQEGGTWMSGIGGFFTGVTVSLLNTALGIVYAVVGGIASLIGLLGNELLPLIMNRTGEILSASSTAGQTVESLWEISLSIANVLFLLALVVMAAAIIFRAAGGYNFKKAFSLLILSIIGANASQLIVNLANQISVALTNLIPEAFGGVGSGGISLDEPFVIISDFNQAFTDQLLSAEGLIGTNPLNIVLGIIIMAIMVLVIGKVILALLERTIHLILRLLYGPIVFPLALFSQDEESLKNWVQGVAEWALVLPFLFFILAAATVFFGEIDPANTVASFQSLIAGDAAGSEMLDQILLLSVGVLLAWYAGDAHKMLSQISSVTGDWIDQHRETLQNTIVSGTGSAIRTTADVASNATLGQISPRLGNLGTQASALFSNVQELPEELGKQAEKTVDRAKSSQARSLSGAVKGLEDVVATEGDEEGRLEGIVKGMTSNITGALRGTATGDIGDMVSELRQADIEDLKFALSENQVDQKPVKAALAANELRRRSQDRQELRNRGDEILEALKEADGLTEEELFEKIEGVNSQFVHRNLSGLDPRDDADPSKEDYIDKVRNKRAKAEATQPEEEYQVIRQRALQSLADDASPNKSTQEAALEIQRYFRDENRINKPQTETLPAQDYLNEDQMNQFIAIMKRFFGEEAARRAQEGMSVQEVHAYMDAIRQQGQQSSDSDNSNNS